MRPFHILALGSIYHLLALSSLLLLFGCEGQEAIVAVIVAVVGAGGIALGIAGRKHNRSRSQDHADHVAKERSLRDQDVEWVNRRLAEREQERRLAEVKAAAEKMRIADETASRVKQVEADGGMSQETFDQIMKEIRGGVSREAFDQIMEDVE